MEKIGKHTYRSADKTYIIDRSFDKEWNVYFITNITGQYQYIVTFHYLRDAKSWVEKKIKERKTT